MDLSLHADAITSEVGGRALQDMQSRSVAQLDTLKPQILSDATCTLWTEKVAGLSGARIDVVLDNAGYELFTDLCLMQWLTESGRCDRVVWHTKVNATCLCGARLLTDQPSAACCRRDASVDHK